MWNNDGVDYDHVDVGNQERAELGKEVFNIDWVPLLPANSHSFICFNH